MAVASSLQSKVQDPLDRALMYCTERTDWTVSLYHCLASSQRIAVASQGDAGGAGGEGVRG